MDRITEQRERWFAQWRAFHRMTQEERLALRQECSFRMRHAMRGWGVYDSHTCTAPKLIKRRRDWRWYDSDTADYSISVRLERDWEDGKVTRAGYDALRTYFHIQLAQRNIDLRINECWKCRQEMPRGRYLCPKCGTWN